MLWMILACTSTPTPTTTVGTPVDTDVPEDTDPPEVIASLSSDGEEYSFFYGYYRAFDEDDGGYGYVGYATQQPGTCDEVFDVVNGTAEENRYVNDLGDRLRVYFRPPLEAYVTVETTERDRLVSITPWVDFGKSYCTSNQDSRSPEGPWTFDCDGPDTDPYEIRARFEPCTE